MSLWRQLTRGLRVLTHRADADRELNEEVQDFMDRAAADAAERGAAPEEARRSAQVELGNAALARDQVRAGGWENAVSTLLADLRFAARQLRSRPGFAIVSVLTLALGVGATTAIFSAVNPILFETLPYPDSRRLVMIFENAGTGPRSPSFGDFHAVASHGSSLESVAELKRWQPSITGSGEPERLEGQRVSAAYFRVLGVEPALGRDFQPGDDIVHGPNVVILSYALWQRVFNGDRSILGRGVMLNGASFTVIGIMPANFENVMAPEAQIWAPLQYDAALPVDGREWGHHLLMIGRLRAGVARGQAAGELGAILHSVAPALKKGYDGAGGVPAGFLVDSLQADLTADVRPALLAVLGAVFLLLVIACVNVTNLLLARGAQRRGEFGVRVALGASRSRVMRQLVTESLLLSVLGGAVGMLIAVYGVHGLVALSPPELARAAQIRVDAPVFLFALAVTSLIGIIMGLIPALHVLRADPQSGIQQNSSRTAGGNQRTRRTLVISEMALALTLLVSAGLLFRSLQRLFSVDPGFDSSQLLTMQVQETGPRYNAAGPSAQFFHDALLAARAVPGVETAGFTSSLPLSGDFDSYGVEFQIEGPDGKSVGLRYAVTPGYLEAMRIPLRRGRLFNDRDDAGAPRVALINESFARRVFKNQDPIGQRVRMGPDMLRPERGWATIVGVVGDVKQTSLATLEEDAFYTPSTQWAFPDLAMTLVLRTHGNPADLARAVKGAIWSVDRDQPIVRVTTMEAIMGLSEARRRFALTIFEAFALAGLMLAAIGIYGVLSGGVSERMRELGVRSALGASRADILALVLRQGVTLTAIGLGIGLLGAFAASGALVTLLYGTSRLDPLTYIGVMALLTGVSVVACWAPAWRASRVDPSITLRAE